jgi:GxxExxY protein
MDYASQASSHYQLTEKVIGCAIEVHRHLGPGLLESTYLECLCHELASAQVNFQREVPLPVIYKAVRLDCGYRMDLFIEDTVIVELKAIEQVLPLHEAQLMTYMKLSGKHVGLLMNSNVRLLKNGITRIVL